MTSSSIRDARLEVGVHQVLRTGVADPAVDHGDLAVIPQVSTGGHQSEQPDTQHPADLHPGGGELLIQRPGPRPRAEEIHQDAASHAALHRPLQGRDYLRPRRVVGEDEVEQMDVVARLVNVGDETVDRAVVVGQQLNRVLFQKPEIAEVLDQDGHGRHFVGRRNPKLLHRRFQPVEHRAEQVR